MTDISHRQPGSGAQPSAQQPAALPFTTDSHSNALDQLERAFAQQRRLAIIIGEGKAGARLLISRFAAGLRDQVTVARVSDPCVDAVAGMRHVIRAIGFDAKNLKLADLENIFSAFLKSQRINRRRTILCIEEAQDNGPWMLDQVGQLIKLAEKGKDGLMVILSGRPALHQMLKKPPLDELAAMADGRISLAPFNLAETRQFVRWIVELSGAEDVGELFDFDAVTLIHELCAGVPDTLSTLCNKCRELAKRQKKTQVTTDVVKDAAELLHMTSSVKSSDVDTVIMEIPSRKGSAIKEGQFKGRLVARREGLVVQDQPINRQRILIGRDEVADIRIPSHLVSRQHALIISSPDGAMLVDLGSTNGTYVDGREVKQCELKDRQVIGIGDCQVEYIAGTERKEGINELDDTGQFAFPEAKPQTAIDFTGELKIVEFDPEETTFDPKRSGARK